MVFSWQQSLPWSAGHRTQNALFVRRSSQRAGRQVSVPEILVKVESLHRRYPVVNGKSDDDFTRLLGPWSRKPLDAEQS